MQSTQPNAPAESLLAAEARPQGAPSSAAVDSLGVDTSGGVPPVRMRIRFAKRGDLRLISHRDLVRSIERLFRRADIDVRQSEGFHPKPRMMFPSALGLGIEGRDEVFEVDLVDAIEPRCLLERLAGLVPPGLELLAAERVPTGMRKAKAKCLWYELPVPDERQAAATAAVEQLMAVDSLPVLRPGRAAAVDLRATLANLTIAEGMLRITLLAMQEAQARPRDILEVLGLADLEAHGLLVRTHVELES